jgi:hypothetical protein
VDETKSVAVLHSLVHLRDDMALRYISALRMSLSAINIIIDGGYFPFVPERYVEVGLCVACRRLQAIRMADHHHDRASSLDFAMLIYFKFIFPQF